MFSWNGASWWHLQQICFFVSIVAGLCAGVFYSFGVVGIEVLAFAACAVGLAIHWGPVPAQRKAALSLHPDLQKMENTSLAVSIHCELGAHSYTMTRMQVVDFAGELTRHAWNSHADICIIEKDGILDVLV